MTMKFLSVPFVLLPRGAFLLVCAVLMLGTPPAKAQKAPPRAVPVEDPPVLPKAVPVDPKDLPKGVVPPRAQAVVEDTAPKGPDQDLFDYAMLAFSQKDYAIASQSFGKYLQSYPQGKQVPWALFRLGECYRFEGKTEEFQRCYREVVDRYPKSEAAPNAAYWLGVSSYNGGDFKAAASYFALCESKTEVPAVKLAAAFYKSEAYSGLKDRKKQLEALKPVLAVKKGNDFLEKALLSSATILQSDGKNKEALPVLMELLETSIDPKVKADAALKAAIIQSEMKKPELAAGMYDQVLKNKEAAPEQQGAALVGLISELSAKGSWDEITDLYNQNVMLKPPAELRPRMFMQVGNAHRAKKSYARAIDLYDMILRFSPDHELAFEAAYWRVYCFYMLEDRRLGQYASEFLKSYGSSHKDREFINKARLLVADYHFNRQEYKPAAEQYGQIQVNSLAAPLRPSTWFHKGWSEAEAGKHSDAVASLSEFINGSPQDAGIPKALAKRGLSYKEGHENDKALADFQRIIKDYPNDESVELAYYLSAVVHGDQGKTKSMIEDFEMLVKLFPTSPAKGEACYRAGVGYIDLKDTVKALPLLRKAVEADKKSYGKVGSEKIQLCLWNKQDAEALAQEVDAYRSTYRDITLPPSMLGFLGLTFFKHEDFTRSARYLSLAATPDVPENTDPRIWNFLAQSLLETKKYDDSVKAVDNFLRTSPDPLSKALGEVTRSKALLGAGKPDESIAAADEGLHIVKDGGVQGQLLIVQGDALIAQGDKLETEGNHDGAAEKWKAAAAKFVVPSQVLADPRVTPEALDKAAKALDRLSDKRGADQMRALLKKDYPKYQAK
ncbi:MAG: Tetratricopeptide repeat-containing protein [Verrucomicrobiaceae bacterium]|nr:Tetratricopeptide repeat-containing protein [Verrucomicrobiaceae bacterium]